MIQMETYGRTLVRAVKQQLGPGTVAVLILISRSYVCLCNSVQSQRQSMEIDREKIDVFSGLVHYFSSLWFSRIFDVFFYGSKVLHSASVYQ